MRYWLDDWIRDVVRRANSRGTEDQEEDVFEKKYNTDESEKGEPVTLRFRGGRSWAPILCIIAGN
jgi:hypothetical protein